MEDFFEIIQASSGTSAKIMIWYHARVNGYSNYNINLIVLGESGVQKTF